MTCRFSGLVRWLSGGTENVSNHSNDFFSASLDHFNSLTASPASQAGQAFRDVRVLHLRVATFLLATFLLAATGARRAAPRAMRTDAGSHIL